MEVYILDSLFRRIAVVDKYESFIWTERFTASGDFKLVIAATQANRTLFQPGTRLGTNVSYRVMTVETVEDATDDEGRRLLEIQGPSLEDIFRHRLAMGAFTGTEANPHWLISGFPRSIMALIVYSIVIDPAPAIDNGDSIPGLMEGPSGLFPDDTIPDPPDSIEWSIEPKDLYTAVKELADEYLIGFRIVLDPTTHTLYFDTYMGVDRTTSQTTFGAVVFSPDLENLSNTSKLTTMALYKNVAYVISPVGAEKVYPTDVDPSVEGFERRALVIKADDITDTVPADATEKMIRRGLVELAKARRFIALDGELAHTTKYVYGVDYNLGDLVELRDDDGATSQMKVTEQIFVDDKEGERAYPTLSMNVFVTPGSWLSMGPTLEWDDMTTEEWEDMP